MLVLERRVDGFFNVSFVDIFYGMLWASTKKWVMVNKQKLKCFMQVQKYLPPPWKEMSVSLKMAPDIRISLTNKKGEIIFAQFFSVICTNLEILIKSITPSHWSNIIYVCLHTHTFIFLTNVLTLTSSMEISPVGKMDIKMGYNWVLLLCDSFI